MGRAIRRRAVVASGGAAWAIGASSTGGAQQGYPGRPIRVVHGYDAGSNPDVIARHLAPPLTELLGQQIAIDPRPGAAERVAAALVARQPADGHTLYLMTGGQAVVSATDTTLQYDMLRDFEFISTVTRFPFVLVVAPARSLGPSATISPRRASSRGSSATAVPASALHCTWRWNCCAAGRRWSCCICPTRATPRSPSVT